MSRSGRKSSNGFDPERMLRVAVEAFMDGGSRGRGAERNGRRGRRVGAGGAVAVGVVVGVGARALYVRARDFDLERAARAVEKRIVN
jgi:hypothetical protein